MIDKRIVAFIGRHHVLTLATASEETIHCCNLFYAYMALENLFVVTSGDDTLHGRHLRDNPRVAASVVLETRVIGKVQGLQIRGAMMRPDEALRREARGAYLGRFPYAAVMAPELWVIRPHYLKLTDNRLGFGQKIIWEERR